MKKIAHELTENLRQNIVVDWSPRENAIESVLQQAQSLSEAWVLMPENSTFAASKLSGTRFGYQ